MAIKEFFVKLASWNSNRNRSWERSAVERMQQENQRERELAEERKEQVLRNVSREDQLRRQSEDVSATVGNRDKA